MEMESSRRQFDRSREPGLKKPRLSDESDHRKPFPAASNPMVSRLRAAEGGGGGGGGYQPQPIPAAAMHQELVSQYKGALAELTFNSKPIITNLTIIAGENLQAAKGIANAVCANIIEVPSEQKLPSLYLLDSIVKNIGKDYIKHFAAKLPEVFCKAFRQVDGPIHQSMRHLFGTWKGVFPLQALQIIEKELGFNSAVNGSATGSTTTNRPDSQSNRPSIHVNPKYLERRLQQPSRTKGPSNDVSGAGVNSIDDVESVGRATSISTGRSWADPSVKIHNMQRLQRGSEGIHEKNIGAEYTDYDYGSDFPRSSGLGIERTNARIADQGYEKPWYGDSSGLAESLSGQRNSLGIKQGFPNYPTPKPTNTNSLLQSVKNISSRSTGGILGDSWKNSDEEEFRWGDVNSRLMDHGASDISSNFRKDRSASVDSDKSGLEDQIQKPQSIRDYTHRINKEVSAEQKDPSVVGHRISSSSWSSLESHSVDGLSHSGTSSIGFPGNGASGSTVATIQHRFQPLKAGPLSLRQNLQLQNLAEQDRAKTQSLGHPDHKVSQFSSQLNIGMHHNPYSRSVTTEKSVTEDVLASSSIPGIQRHQYVFPPQVEDPTESEPSNQIQKQLPHRISSLGISTTLSSYAPDRSNSLSVNTLVDSSTSSILAAVMKSGVLSNSSITDHNLRQPPLQKAQSVLPSGPVSIKSTNPRSKVVPALSEGRSSHDNQLGSVKISQKKQSPVRSDPPPSLSPMHSGSEKEKASKDVKNAADPISSLLSSLVAKGLISASKTESPTQTPRVAAVSSETKKKKKKKKSLGVANTSSARKSLVSVSTVSSTKTDVASVLEPSSSRPVSFVESTKSEIKSIIGFDFKQDLIREFHPTVVSDLLDGFEHTCNTCGLRLKLEEQLNRHMELHDVKESSGPNASRRWYVSSFDWISRLTPAFESVELEEETGKDEPMVPSDESQCVCVLCGEVFEDFFCQERDEWMFKGAKHLMVPSGVGGEVENLEDKEGLVTGPIVHANCISETSLQNLGLAGRVKTEKDV